MCTYDHSNYFEHNNFFCISSNDWSPPKISLFNYTQAESWKDEAGVVIFALVTVLLMIACAIPFLVCDMRRVSSAARRGETPPEEEEEGQFATTRASAKSFSSAVMAHPPPPAADTNYATGISSFFHWNIQYLVSLLVKSTVILF